MLFEELSFAKMFPMVQNLQDVIEASVCRSLPPVCFPGTTVHNKTVVELAGGDLAKVVVDDRLVAMQGFHR